MGLGCWVGATERYGALRSATWGWVCPGRRYGALRGVGCVRVGVTERYVGLGVSW